MQPNLQDPADPLPQAAARARRGRERYFPAASDAQWNDWRWQFRERVTTLEELARHLPIPRAEWAARQQVLQDFSMGITPYYLSLIDADDPHDPILRQVVPLEEEHRFRAVGEEDPLGEEAFSPVPGITHRYPDRVLMVISNNCAIYCRYCTRKRTMYEGATPDVEIDTMVDYIRRTPAVRDVVVSGGDPLNYANSKLESILAKLRAIPHLEIIRIGTRVPVALPQRIDDELCAMLQKYHPLWVNVHFNHPAELTPEAAAACDKLARAGIPLNNQAVLLKGVNDSVATIKSLCQGLMRMRVRPYYLYQCDPVRGAEHFRTSIQKGIEIIEGMRGHTSGLAVPTYVIDGPGGGGKIPVAPNYLLHYDREHGRALLRNYSGKVYEYLEPQSEVAARAAPKRKPARKPVTASKKRALPAGEAVPAAKAAEKSAAADGAARNGKGAVRPKNGSAHGNGAVKSNAADARGQGDGGSGKPLSSGAAGPLIGKSRWVHGKRSREQG